MYIMSVNKLLFPFFLCFVSGVFAQINLPVARNLKPAYDKQTRTSDGRPGRNYWQNQADYDIAVNFDPATRYLQGSAAIDYVNNSPDTLKQVWFKLYPNLYMKGSVRLMPVDSSDLTDGVKIEQLVINGLVTEEKQRRINGTNMTVTIPALPTWADIFNSALLILIH